MDEELRIRLLGSPVVFVGEEPLSGFVSIKAQTFLSDFGIARYLDSPHDPGRNDFTASLWKTPHPSSSWAARDMAG